LTRRQAPIARDFPHIYDALDLSKAQAVAQWLVPRFERGEFDSVYLLFNEFKSAITQRVVTERLLPLNDPSPVSGNDALPAPAGEFLYEPTQKALLERLVPMYVEISVYRALLESHASFFGAQMTAMDAATRNAKEMISKYTLIYNRARQAAITKELMEIIGGAEALKT
jgi:F-type H+-transporting ATPase subunit gamma